MMVTTYFSWADAAELERRLAWRARDPELAEKSLDEVVGLLENKGMLVGTPERIRERIGAYGTAGVEELMPQWLDQEDFDGIEGFAETVLRAG